MIFGVIRDSRNKNRNQTVGEIDHLGNSMPSNPKAKPTRFIRGGRAWVGVGGEAGDEVPRAVGVEERDLLGREGAEEGHPQPRHQPLPLRGGEGSALMGSCLG